MKLKQVSIYQILFVVLVLKQLLWIAFIPMWQYPDEQAHFAQVQNVAEGNPINPARKNNTSHEIDESEILLETKRDGFGNNKFTYHQEYNIAYSNTTVGIHELAIKNFPHAYRQVFVTNEATAYPPLYYQTAAVFYNLVTDKDLITRLFVTRLVNLFYFLILAYTVILIGRRLFARQPVHQLAFVILVTFHPMLSFLYGGVNSDNALIVIFTISIYLSLRMLEKGIRYRDYFFVILTIFLALKTKETGRLLPLVYLYPLTIVHLEKKGRGILLFVLGSLLVGLVFSQPLFSLISGRQLIPEIPNIQTLKQAPMLSFWEHMRWTLTHTYREVIPWYWGVFRWLSLTYPRVVHRFLNWLSVIAVAGIFFTLFKDWGSKLGGIFANVKQVFWRKKLSNKIAVGNVKLKFLWFLIIASLMHFMALTTFNYFFRWSHGFPIGIQGRYFFPTLAAHMGILLIGLTSFTGSKVTCSIIAKTIAVGFIILHSYAFIFVNGSYFDMSTVSSFFIQASQYKPWWFKSPGLEIFSFVYIAFFVWYIIKLTFIRSEKD